MKEVIEKYKSKKKRVEVLERKISMREDDRYQIILAVLSTMIITYVLARFI